MHPTFQCSSSVRSSTTRWVRSPNDKHSRKHEQHKTTMCNLSQDVHRMIKILRITGIDKFRMFQPSKHVHKAVSYQPGVSSAMFLELCCSVSWGALIVLIIGRTAVFGPVLWTQLHSMLWHHASAQQQEHTDVSCNAKRCIQMPMSLSKPIVYVVSFALAYSREYYPAKSAEISATSHSVDRSTHAGQPRYHHYMLVEFSGIIKLYNL